MSYAWSFESFDHGGFQQFFGNASADKETELVQALTCEDCEDYFGFTDLAHVERVARQVARTGIAYDGLSSEDAEMLDQILGAVFCDEGLAEELGVEHESPDFVVPAVISELIQRAEGSVQLTVLPLLVHGWRFGAQDLNANCEYCILPPEHVTTLVNEVRAVTNLPKPWSADYMPELVTECLIEVMDSIGRKQKWLYAQLG
jgi:hypothetical protein